MRSVLRLLLGAISLPTLVSTQKSPPTPYLRTPSPRQLAWHQLEYYAFVHFGPNTFTNEEWGRSQSTPDVFAPTDISTDQWAATFSAAGMKGFVLTAKHHDGMALWDTNSTLYKIANSQWAKDRAARGEETDVVRMAAQSAKKYGLKFGIYLSPWDIHRDPAMPKEGLKETMYAEPQIFGDSTPGDYNGLYAQQLSELVSMKIVGGDGEKVELFELWLDGASGSDTKQTFNWTSFRDIIRTHQPSAIMWGHQGVDARWVGNEDGVTASTNWHTISRTQDQTRYKEAELQTGIRDGTYWTPAEADARLRDGWFFHAIEKSKTPEQLMDMYLKSVGRGVSLLLDVPPDMSGRILEGDAEVLRRFKRLKDAFLNRNLLMSGVKVKATSIRGNDSTLYGPANVLDNSTETYWALDDSDTTGALEIDLGSTYTVDAFIVKEHIALGQRIGGYAIDVLQDGMWKTVVEGMSMGYKRVDTLSKGVETGKLKLRITQANATPVVQMVQVLGVAKGL